METADEDSVLNVLRIVHLYGIEELQADICRWLSVSLTVQNVCIVLRNALELSLRESENSCFAFIDDNAYAVMQTRSFLELTEVELEQLLSRDPFCAREVDIFEAVHRWIIDQGEKPGVSSIIENVRFPLIALYDLTSIVLRSNLVDSKRVLDLIRKKCKHCGVSTEWRAYVELETNVATADRGMEVLQGRLQTRVDSGTRDPGYTDWLEHSIHDSTGIVISLAKPYFINKISVYLICSSSYCVQVSLNRVDWHEVIDHTDYLCHSTQQLYFEPRVVRYVPFKGTDVSEANSNTFKLANFKAFYSEKPLKLRQGFPRPKENIASPKMGARILRGHGSIESAFVVGQSERDPTREIFSKRVSEGPLIVELTQPFFVNSMRISLRDDEKRPHTYTVAVSRDHKEWTPVASFADVLNHCWQYVKFEPSPFTFIKIDARQDRALHSRIYLDIECPAIGFGQ